MLLQQEMQRIVNTALWEDLAWGDATSEAVIPQDARASGAIVAREEGVLAGLEVAAVVFAAVDPQVEFEALAQDGDALSPGQAIVIVKGLARSILGAERTSLNFLQHLSGIATLTARYVQAVAGHQVRIIDTRKTTPGLRSLEKYAVVVGGGANHRQNLSDGILIKDNHLATLAARRVGLAEAVALARQRARHIQRVEVEVTTVDEAREAVEAGADAVLLDNMTPAEMRRAVEAIGGRAVLEASGGITLQNIAEVAETGVDLISVGALTHSVRALDIALDFVAEA